VEVRKEIVKYRELEEGYEKEGLGGGKEEGKYRRGR
jgi:hypothetical protein